MNLYSRRRSLVVVLIVVVYINPKRMCQLTASACSVAGAYSGTCPGGGTLNVFSLSRVWAQHPLGPENTLKSINFTGPGGGLSPIAPLNAPLFTSELAIWKQNAFFIWRRPLQFKFLKRKSLMIKNQEVRKNRIIGNIFSLLRSIFLNSYHIFLEL